MSKNKKKKNKLTPEQQARKKQRLSELGLSLKTLISNDACIKTAREWKGFKGHGVPIIVGILAVLLALIPSLATRLKVNAGDNFLGAPSYAYDIGLTNFTKAMHENSAHISIENGEIKTEGNLNAVFDYSDHASATSKWYSVKAENIDGTPIAFEVFINNTVESDDTFFSNIAGDDTAAKTPDGYVRPSKMNHSYLAIGRQSIVFARYNQNDGAVNLYLKGAYDRLEGFDLINGTYPGDAAKGYDAVNACAANWKGVIVKAYETAKLQQTFQYVGIVGAIYVGLLGLFGFLLWVMTRGKNNPMRVFTIWETQKMAYWASFAPAVLSIAVGFMLSQSSLGMFAFIFLYGMRIMWMSMKALRPVQ